MSLRIVSTLAAATLLSALPARADKLDKDSKRWLDEVRPIMLADEEKTFRGLKDKGEREEFQKIFWARRDPNLEAEGNEFQAGYNAARLEADKEYKTGGTAGSLTDCGRVLLLLGKPDEVKVDGAPSESATFRPPQTWTYRDRPGQTFAGGEAKISFSANCQLPQGNRLGEALQRIAESKVVNPNIGYKRGPDNKLVKLADQLPRPSPVQELLKTPRQDFAVSAEPRLYLRSEDGASTYVAGLLRADAASFGGAAAPTKVVVAAQAKDASGKLVGNVVREASVTAKGADVLVSWGVALKPGDYTVNVAALDPATGKGSVVTVPVSAPDYSTSEMAVTPLVLLEDLQENTSTSRDAADPMAEFLLTGARLVPRFSNVFTKADNLTVLAVIYGGATDPATGKPAVAAVYSILKDGKPRARADELAGPSAVVGPIPLSNFEPGTYTVQLKVTDKTTKKEVTREATFDVR